MNAPDDADAAARVQQARDSGDVAGLTAMLAETAWAGDSAGYHAIQAAAAQALGELADARGVPALASTLDRIVTRRRTRGTRRWDGTLDEAAEEIRDQLLAFSVKRALQTIEDPAGLAAAERFERDARVIAEAENAALQARESAMTREERSAWNQHKKARWRAIKNAV